MSELSLFSLCAQLQATGVLDKFLQKSPECERFAPYFHRADGIHGVGHTLRVLFWVMALGEFETLPESDRELLAVSAQLHDIGRVNDWICEEHGFRSVSKMLEHGLVSFNDVQDLHLVSYMISYHCIDDIAARRCLDEDRDIADKQRAWQLFQIFKDSDGLDRVRIKDLDVRYLRTSSAPRMSQAAVELFEATAGRRIIFPGE